MRRLHNRQLERRFDHSSRHISMNRHELDKLLSAWLDDELSQDEKLRLQGLLESDPEAAARAEEARRFHRFTHRALRQALVFEFPLRQTQRVTYHPRQLAPRPPPIIQLDCRRHGEDRRCTSAIRLCRAPHNQPRAHKHIQVEIERVRAAAQQPAQLSHGNWSTAREHVHDFLPGARRQRLQARGAAE